MSEHNHLLVIGDAEECLKPLSGSSMQLIVTSPPYWSLKDYDCSGQIGREDTYKEYLWGLRGVWKQCWRVLEPGCRMCINIGDQFLRARVHGRYGVAPIHADVIHQMAQCVGALYLGGIVWRKITTTRPSGGGTWMGSTYYPRDGYVTYEHEYILIFKKEGKARGPSKEAKERSRLTKEQRSLWFRGIWDLPPVRQRGHRAMFPVELPERLIRMFTFWGEDVLDPFVGSGTTLEAAARCGRSSSGIELNPNYIELCKKRVPELVVVQGLKCHAKP